MANRGRLRPSAAILPEYLENPFPEAGTETHALPVLFAERNIKKISFPCAKQRKPMHSLSRPASSALSLPRPLKLISVFYILIWLILFL